MRVNPTKVLPYFSPDPEILFDLIFGRELLGIHTCVRANYLVDYRGMIYESN